MNKYEFSNDMKEISGLGGEYEQACRKMLIAGLEWLDKYPNADPKYHGYKDIYGIIQEDSRDAKALSAAVISAVSDCTGAMHQAVVSSLLYIKKHGWQAYTEKMKE